MRRLPIILVSLLLAGSAAAQQTTVEIEDLRPEEWRFDNLTVEELPIPVAPTLPDLNAEENAAAEVSDDVLGPRVPRDEAYGAFQRGYYLTALQLALPRAENGDAAAQTLIATIYADGLGIRQNLATASSWYALASDNGDVLATFELAMLNQDGRGVPQDRAARRRAFRQGRRHGQHAGKVQSRAALRRRPLRRAQPHQGRGPDEGGRRLWPPRGAVRLRHDADRGRGRSSPTRSAARRS